MSEQNDYSDELRGDGDDVANIKRDSSWFPALAVGIVISLAQIYVAKQSDRGDTLIEVKTQLATLVKQFDDFSKRDYVSRADLEREREKRGRMCGDRGDGTSHICVLETTSCAVVRLERVCGARIRLPKSQVKVSVAHVTSSMAQVLGGRDGFRRSPVIRGTYVASIDAIAPIQ